MVKVEYSFPEGSFQYGKLGQDGIELVQYQGLAGHVEIPEVLPWKELVKGTEPEHAGEEMGDATDSFHDSFHDSLHDSFRDCLPVRALAKKMFLSKKYLRSVVVPASVESVGDWAFAYCDSLREVTFLGREVMFGKDVFKECPNLRCVRFLNAAEEAGYRGSNGTGNSGTGSSGTNSGGTGSGGTGSHGAGGHGTGSNGTNCGGTGSGGTGSVGVESGRCDQTRDGVGALLAAAVTQMDASYLLDAREAGSPEWLGKWDARMLAILRAADDEGYAKQILCGEEDYESADYETFLRNSRKRKVRLLLLRLLWPMGLAPAAEEECKAYLLSHTLGCATEETWAVIRDEYGNRREFYELFATLGCLTRENAPDVIAETRQDCPEMKAYFLRYQAEYFGTTGFFDDMEL
ncbi:MAG: leucine-rich repeat protein [Lachnospiraceae bacterium]|nr:leucine-rich repeat protein [Lachnospiraceae bacterium]